MHLAVHLDSHEPQGFLNIQSADFEVHLLVSEANLDPSTMQLEVIYLDRVEDRACSEAFLEAESCLEVCALRFDLKCDLLDFAIFVIHLGSEALVGICEFGGVFP